MIIGNREKRCCKAWRKTCKEGAENSCRREKQGEGPGMFNNMIIIAMVDV